MTQLKSTRLDDQSDHLPENLHYNADHWIGTWHNTMDETRHIGRLEISKQDDQYFISVYGVCTPDPCEWGTVELDIYNGGIESSYAEGFTAHYNFDFCETQLSGIAKQNVLVITTYTRFKDGSKRHNYYLREFYIKK